MLNIVIPMAGSGSRFKKEGYRTPKPLIKIWDKEMIKVVIDNITPMEDHKFIFICQNEHIKKYNLEKKFQSWTRNFEIISINEITNGAACTVLLSRKLINDQNPLMIVNSDQYVDIKIDTYLKKMRQNEFDGYIMTMMANDPKWSYVKMNNNLVKGVFEKRVVSNEATVGIYNFKFGQEFCLYADLMIKKGEMVNNEYYVAPVYNEMINSNKKVGIFNIGSVNDGMYGLGTPEDLNNFLNLDISKKV